mgnify:FL=1
MLSVRWNLRISPASKPRRRSRHGEVARAGPEAVQLDLNSPEFQTVFFGLESGELRQVVAGLRRLLGLQWNDLYRHTGFHWEAIEHLRAPNGAKICSFRLSQKIRAVGYRDGELLRLVSLHPDHDSAYKR